MHASARRYLAPVGAGTRFLRSRLQNLLGVAGEYSVLSLGPLMALAPGSPVVTAAVVTVFLLPVFVFALIATIALIAVLAGSTARRRAALEVLRILLHRPGPSDGGIGPRQRRRAPP